MTRNGVRSIVFAAVAAACSACGPKGDSGTVGPPGPTGQQGSTGPAGAPATIVFGTTAGTACEGNDSRLSDARAPLPGSFSYIQNGTAPQPASFNVTGSGTFGGTLTAPQLTAGDANFNGTVAAAQFAGSGAGLTQLPGANITGAISDTALSSNVPLLSRGSNSFAGSVQAASLSVSFLRTGMASPPASCASFSAGLMYWSTATGSIQVCDGTAWKSYVAVDSAGAVAQDLPMGSHRMLVTSGIRTTTVFGLYCGITAATTGSFSDAVSGATGYRAAKVLCENACASPGAHMCSSHEAALSAQVGALVAPGGWIASANAANPSMSDCQGWTAGTSTGWGGTVMQVDAGGNATPVMNPCVSSFPIVCCR